MKLFDFAIAPDVRPAIQSILDADEAQLVGTASHSYFVNAEQWPKIVKIFHNATKPGTLTINRDGSLHWSFHRGSSQTQHCHMSETDTGIFISAPLNKGLHALYNDGRMLVFLDGKALTESYVVGKLGYYPVCLSEREKAILDPEYQHPVGEFPHRDEIALLGGRCRGVVEAAVGAGYPMDFAVMGEELYLDIDNNNTAMPFDVRIFSYPTPYIMGKDGGWMGGLWDARYTVGDFVDFTLTGTKYGIMSRLGLQSALDFMIFSIKPLMDYWGERVVRARMENQSGEWEIYYWKSGRDITDFYTTQFGDRIDLSEDELFLLQMA